MSWHEFACHAELRMRDGVPARCVLEIASGAVRRCYGDKRHHEFAVLWRYMVVSDVASTRGEMLQLCGVTMTGMQEDNGGRTWRDVATSCDGQVSRHDMSCADDGAC